MNPGLGINFNVGIPGGSLDSSYGAGIDYHVSGVDIRLHTRSTSDTSPVTHRFNSGFSTDWPVKDFSKPIGQWNHSRILCKASRIQFWLNGKQAFDIDMERPSDTGRDHWSPAMALAVDDWISRRKNGIYLSIIAPFSNELAVPRVEVRSIAVRQLKAIDPHQPEARTIIKVGEAPGPWRGGSSPAPPPTPVPGGNWYDGPTEIRPR
jgi:hypothetical protein